jgi:hypothetical protein
VVGKGIHRLFVFEQAIRLGAVVFQRLCSANSYGCWGEGEGRGWFVSGLWTEKQPIEDGVGMIFMVDGWKK